MNSAPALEPNPPSALDPRRFALRQRFSLWLVTWASYFAISLIGPTLRYSISWEEPPSPPDATYERPVIYSFWHRAVFASAWLWRNIGIAVMVSRSFDGEFIARTIEKLGFVAVRGSSSRGGAQGLLGLKSQLERGNLVAFTIDGPRGPKYVAKPGPVLLSRATSMPMVAFYVAVKDPWVLNTWDSLIIPKPFSRALVRFSRKIRVPQDADDEQMTEFLGQLQSALDRVTAFAEANVAGVGSDEFPTLTKERGANGSDTNGKGTSSTRAIKP
ncbi:MAG: lysophospholipid acyltransferase family protein [Terriglobales bacterium]